MFKATPLLVALLMLICISTCAAKQKDGDFDIPLQTATIVVDGMERTYRYFVPATVKAPLPMVMVLHGGFSDGAADHIVGYTKFTELAQSENFIVVYPVAYDNNWNDGRGLKNVEAQRLDIDDVKFLRNVITDLSSQLFVDQSRVFCTGMSNGAWMSNRMAAEASDVIAGVAPVVGAMSVSVFANFDPEYPVPAFIIQSNTDPIIPISGGRCGLSPFRNRGIAVSTFRTLSKYVERNGADSNPSVSMLKDTDPKDGTTTLSAFYEAGESGAAVQLYIVQGGGHTWPGDQTYLSELIVGKTSRDFFATEAIWEFFKTCPGRFVQ